MYLSVCRNYYSPSARHAFKCDLEHVIYVKYQPLFSCHNFPSLIGLVCEGRTEWAR